MRYASLLAGVVYLATFGSFLLSRGTLIYLDFVPPLYPEKYLRMLLSEPGSALQLMRLPLQLSAYLATKVMPPFLFYELTLLLCFVAGGAYLYRLLRDGGAYFGVLLLLYNPMIYLRATAGQLGMVAATALAPVFLYYLFAYFENPGLRRGLKLGAAFTLAAVFQGHYLVLNGIVFFIYAAILLIKRETDLKSVALASASLVIANAYWLVFLPVLKPEEVSGITMQHIQFFMPKAELELSTPAKLAGLYGFWREYAVDRIYDEVPIYLYAMYVFLLLYLSIHGFVSSSRDAKSVLFLTLVFTGIILAMAAPQLDIKPFRDSHKFVYLTLLGYVYLIPRGIRAHRFSSAVLLLTLAAVLYFNHMQVLLGGQLQPLEYPAEYVQAGKVIDGLGGEVVYFPWRLYMSYSWAMNATPDGRLAAPINSVTRRFVSTGCDPGQDFCVETPEQRSIRRCVEARSVPCLEELGVRYAVVDTCATAPMDYGWVTGRRVFSGECLRIVRLGV